LLDNKKKREKGKIVSPPLSFFIAHLKNRA